jgi:hypothetical protein
MAKRGSTPIPSSPASSALTALWWVRASRACVVHAWPPGLTYCRSSRQMGHASGSPADSASCVPHAVQM